MVFNFYCTTQNLLRITFHKVITALPSFVYFQISGICTSVMEICSQILPKNSLSFLSPLFKTCIRVWLSLKSAIAKTELGVSLKFAITKTGLGGHSGSTFTSYTLLLRTSFSQSSFLSVTLFT